MIFWVVRGVKGQKIAQNRKEQLSCIVSQEQCGIWSWVLVHLCKMMLSPGVFFHFLKVLIFQDQIQRPIIFYDSLKGIIVLDGHFRDQNITSAMQTAWMAQLSAWSSLFGLCNKNVKFRFHLTPHEICPWETRPVSPNILCMLYTSQHFPFLFHLRSWKMK